MTPTTTTAVLDWPGGIALLAVSTALLYSFLANDRGLVPHTSVADGRTYLVRSAPDQDEAADMLAEIVRRCAVLIDELPRDDPRAARLRRRFRAGSVSELSQSERGATSYSVDKGERLVFCVRDPETQRLDRMNTVMYVALHEMGHLAVDEVGHPPEFWSAMRWIVEEAVRLGLYELEDYGEAPVEYCGIQISSNVAA